MVGFNKMILLPFEKKIIVAYRPNNGTFVHLLHDHISGLCRFHSKSIFLFMTFDFVNVTIKSRFHVGSTINFVHYVGLHELYEYGSATSKKGKRELFKSEPTEYWRWIGCCRACPEGCDGVRCRIL